MSNKDSNNSGNVITKPKRVISRPDDIEGGEEIEITAHISLPPHERGWGWMVVFSAFFNIFILDGITFTFGSLLHDIANDLQVSDSLVALMNSIAVALYFITSPLASAFINRFGFRECAMTGSMICSFSLITSYFTTTFASLCIFYGGIAGFGYSLINLSSGLVVGFYFEKMRSLALSIATCGSSVGVMTLFPINTYFVKLGGWRTTTLFHSGLFGLVFFLSMSFRPLLSVTVFKTEDDPTCTTYLPSLPNALVGSSISGTKTSGLVPTATERLFSAISNANFPTAAAVIEEETLSTGQPGTSTAIASKLTLLSFNPQSNARSEQLKEAQSSISRSNRGRADNTSTNVQRPVRLERSRWRMCWERCFHWEPHTHNSRPMYRDDVFYEGKLEHLPVYQKSMIETREETKTGMNYQLAVSRAVTAQDLLETRGVFTTAARRVLATMIDPLLLKKFSFLLLCCSGFFTYMGFLVPYVYLQDRNIKAGVDPKHCTFFISVIGLSNACGRLILGSLASKIDPLKLFSCSCIVAGVSTILSGLSYSLLYQYLYCCVFGFTISSVVCLRSVILVSLYGLDKLTNATGMMLIFLGLGNLVSTPMAGIIKNTFGYSTAFYVAGTFITLSGIILLPVKTLSIKENKNVCST